jgi:acyl-[acyl-carrier-protein] desaturase
LEPEETIAAVAARAAEMQAVGADIDAYQDKVRTIADVGIFDDKVLRQVVSDSITAWGLDDRAELSEFVQS